MKKEVLHLAEKRLIGLSVRTSYQNEIDPSKAKITPCVTRFFQEGISEKIPNLKNPAVTFCAYTDYENDYQGEYTYFIGQEVTSLDDLPDELSALTIPSQNYVKFTTGPAPIPQVIINAWQKIWQTSETELGGKRTYHVDFEIYDERAYDPHNAVIDLYVGIDK